MRIGVAAYEHLPYGSGIGLVAGEVGARLRARGHDVVPIAPGFPGIAIPPSVVFRFGGPAILEYWREAATMIRNGGFDAVWSHNPLFAADLPCPHVATVHTTFRGLHERGSHHAGLTPYYAWMRRVEQRRLASLRAAEFTTIDPQVVRELRAAGVDQPIDVITNGVDVQVYRPGDKIAARAATKAGDGPVVLSLGRLTAAKRPLELLRAWRAHEEAGGKGELVVAGGGEMTRRVLSEMNGLRRARYVGHIQSATKLAHLQAADLFVIGSAYEGKPLALYEALSCGVPALVSQIPNLAFVEETDAGASADFSRPAAVAEKLASMLGDVAGLARMGHNARHYAVAHADWERAVDLYEAKLVHAVEARA